jgi:limonene-1,2-epoxide hydrolase
MGEEGRSIVEGLWQAMNDADFKVGADFYDDNATQEWPQSGERIVGKANIMAINENYPGMPKATVRRIIGAGDVWTSEVTLDYSGDRYESVSIFEIKDGKIVKETDYFAAPFEAPQWRAQWVQKM